MTVKIMPAYLIDRSTRCRLSISLKTEVDIPTVLRTSNALRCALCNEIRVKINGISAIIMQVHSLIIMSINILRNDSNNKSQVMRV